MILCWCSGFLVEFSVQHTYTYTYTPNKHAINDKHLHIKTEGILFLTFKGRRAVKFDQVFTTNYLSEIRHDYIDKNSQMNRDFLTSTHSLSVGQKKKKQTLSRFILAFIPTIFE